jgi:hypothetical protein
MKTLSYVCSRMVSFLRWKIWTDRILNSTENRHTTKEFVQLASFEINA